MSSQAVWNAFLPPLDPDTRRPVSLRVFFDAILPAMLLQQLSAYIYVNAYPKALRFAVLPIALLTFWHSAVSVNLSCAEGWGCNPGLQFLNVGHLIAHTYFAMQVLTWAFSPPPRTLDGRTPSTIELTQTFRGLNLAGVGASCYVAREWRPTSKPLFLLCTLVSFLFHLVLSDVLHFYVQTFNLQDWGPRTGGAPLLARDAWPSPQSTWLTFVGAVVMYAVIQMSYDVGTLVGVLLGSSPTEWPPIFKQPWLSTSLKDMWGRRWHQLFRLYFIGVGAAPTRWLGLSKDYAVLGVFFASGTLHVLAVWGMGKGEYLSNSLGFFVMNGVGVGLERAWDICTGRRVGGWLGWMWTMTWMLWWGNWFMDSYARAGLFGSTFYPDEWRPASLLGLRLHD